MPLKLTGKQIEECRTVKGGWTKAQLAAWGVPWPPPRGWRYALENGLPIPKPRVMSALSARRHSSA